MAVMNYDDFGQAFDDAYAAGYRDGAKDERTSWARHGRAYMSILADRERELMELKGPCLSGSRSDQRCRLHRAHSGPCDIPAKGSDGGDGA